MIRRLGRGAATGSLGTARDLSHGDAAALRQGAGGGRNQCGSYLSSAELYDPATGSWSSDRQPRHRTRIITRRRCCPQARCWWRGDSVTGLPLTARNSMTQTRPRLHLHLHLRGLAIRILPTLPRRRLSPGRTIRATIAMNAALRFRCRSRSAFTGRPLTVQRSGPTALLDLVGTSANFTLGCVTLPSTNWGMAILPYQGDLLTVSGYPGCHGFPGGTCGIFTSTTGTAPNRQFNIEWRACTSPTRLRQPTSQWCSTRTNQASLTSSMAQCPTMALMRPAECKQAPPVRRRPSPVEQPRSSMA